MLVIKITKQNYKHGVNTRKTWFIAQLLVTSFIVKVLLQRKQVPAPVSTGESRNDFKSAGAHSKRVLSTNFPAKAGSLLEPAYRNECYWFLLAGIGELGNRILKIYKNFF